MEKPGKLYNGKYDVEQDVIVNSDGLNLHGHEQGHEQGHVQVPQGSLSVYRPGHQDTWYVGSSYVYTGTGTAANWDGSIK